MNRGRFAFAATLLGVTFAAGTVPAQTVKDPGFTPILAGKKFTPPIRGQADVEFTKPVTKREKDIIVTKVLVKNVSTGPIARLTVDETWYDKAGALVIGGKGTFNGLLPPGEVQTITIETPYNPKMNANNFNFSHANGTVKPVQVPKIDGGAASAKAAPAKKN